MSPEEITDIIRQALWVALKISSPSLLVAMIIGFTISLLQSITQIQEMTLTFVPKLLVFALIIGLSFPWMMKTMVSFAHLILITHWDRLIRFT